MVGLLCASLSVSALADIRFGSTDDPDAVPWKEGGHSLPTYPKDENLIEFYVSATSTAKFFIDSKSIQTGTEDGVVRYTLVVKTAGGARNVSFEGLHCAEAKLRTYATGRADGTWVDNPKSAWQLMKRVSMNLHQGALARNYFCPNFVPIFTVDEGVDALRRGVHPSAPGEQ